MDLASGYGVTHMKITKRQLRRIIRESCGLEAAATPEESIQPGIFHPETGELEDFTGVPVPEDYNAVRDMLEAKPDIVDMGISLVMDMAGASCERSTAQGIIDHLQDMLDGGGAEAPPELADPGAFPGEASFGVEMQES